VPPGEGELREIFQTTPNLMGIAKLTPGRVPPPPILAEKQQYGDVSGISDRDGVNRRVYLYPISDTSNPEAAIPNLALQLAYLYLQAEGIEGRNSDRNNAWLQLGRVHFPHFEANDGGYVRADAGSYQILLNWRKPPQSFKQVGFFPVIDGQIAPDLFRERIVLIGVSGASFNDFHESPFTKYSGRFVRGIDLQAQAASQILSAVLDGRPLMKTWSWLPSGLWMVAWCSLSPLLLWRLRRFSSGLAGTITLASFLSAVTVAITFLAFLHSWWLPLVPPLLGIWLSSLASQFSFDQQKLSQANRQLRLANQSLRQLNGTLAQQVAAKKQQLEQAQQELLQQEKLGLFSQFTDILREGLLKPLNTVQIQLQTLDNYLKLPLGEITPQQLNDFQDQAVLLLEKINQSLMATVGFLGRLPQLQKWLPFELVNQLTLAELLQEVVRTVVASKQEEYPWLRENSIIFSCRLELELPSDFNFRRNLAWILLHLLENALTAIDLKPEKLEPQIKVWLLPEPDGSLQLIVEDNGIGLNTDQLHSATTPFKSFTGKLGMGLFEVEKIVENYQGHLRLDSRSGQGAKVTVTLPATIP
jgi:CHASE2 domain-containing sensor protein